MPSLLEFLFGIPALTRRVAALETKTAALTKNQNIMETDIKALDAAIAELPGKVATAVDGALKPIIDAIKAKQGTTDFSAEIEALGKVGETVAAQVATDLTPAA